MSHKHICKFNCTKLVQDKIYYFCGIYRLESTCYCSMFLLAVTTWQQFVWSAAYIDENISFFPPLNTATTFYQKSSDLLYVTDLLKLNKKQMYSTGNQRVCMTGQQTHSSVCMDPDTLLLWHSASCHLFTTSVFLCRVCFVLEAQEQVLTQNRVSEDSWVVRDSASLSRSQPLLGWKAQTLDNSSLGSVLTCAGQS